MREEKKIKKKSNIIFYILILLLSFSFFLFNFYYFLLKPPANFPIKTTIKIEQGESFAKIAEDLEKKRIIRSAFIFKLLAKKNHLNHFVAGRYIFSKVSNANEVLWKIHKGKIENEFQKFTIFEGEPNYLIARRLAVKMKNINEKKFLSLAQGYEGELYPDTYNLDLDFDEKDALNFFLKNFHQQLQKNDLILPEDRKSQILKIASLVEAEAGRASYEDKRHVAGIIYNRLKKNIPLQLDYVFFYILKQDKQKLSPKSIERVIWKGKQIDSPFNNYKYTGLPPNPISNPSIDSIKATLKPMDTKDLYYITGKDGQFYYSQTGAGHFRNIKKYLR